jgi:hypothetical protein
MANALILNNKVVDVVDTKFEVAPSMTWVDCPADVQIGWDYDGSTFSDPNVKTSEELLDELRNERNQMLEATDYLALSDNTLTAEMATYRQALRDITVTYTSLDDVVWPSI